MKLKQWEQGQNIMAMSRASDEDARAGNAKSARASEDRR